MPRSVPVVVIGAGQAGLAASYHLRRRAVDRTPYARAAAARGALVRHPMFTAIEPGGVRMADGTFQPADVILSATGFRQAVDHLEPLRLRGELGGIALDGTAVAADPRIRLIGCGPSQSTVGANRAGRAAAIALSKRLTRT